MPVFFYDESRFKPQLFASFLPFLRKIVRKEIKVKKKSFYYTISKYGIFNAFKLSAEGWQVVTYNLL